MWTGTTSSSLLDTWEIGVTDSPCLNVSTVGRDARRHSNLTKAGGEKGKGL